MGFALVGTERTCGVLVVRGRTFDTKSIFRILARKTCDQYFRQEADLPTTEKTGTIFRFFEGKSQKVENATLTLKEYLFGEYGEKNFRARAIYHTEVVSYNGLTNYQLDFLKKVLGKMGLEVVADLCTKVG